MIISSAFCAYNTMMNELQSSKIPQSSGTNSWETVHYLQLTS